jgi:hypothetical protein
MINGEIRGVDKTYLIQKTPTRNEQVSAVILHEIGFILGEPQPYLDIFATRANLFKS